MTNVKPRVENRALNMQLFSIISINSCIYSIISFLLQTYLIVLQIKYLNLYKKKVINNDSVIYVCCLVISILFTIVNLFLNALRIGNYSHDSIKLGKDFSLYAASNKLLKLIATGQKKREKFLNFFLYNKYWKRFLPIGQLLHVFTSFCLLYADLIVNKNLIELKYLPIGEIFSTKLDFLFGDPMNRIEMINQQRNESQLLTTIIKSTDDFINLNNNIYNTRVINFSCLNLIIALIVLIVKLSQTFWHTSYLASLLILFYSLNLSILCLVSYSAFELLFKFQVLSSQYKLNLRLLLNQNSLVFIYGLSLCLYFASSCLFINFAFKKYAHLLEKFENNLFKYFHIDSEVAMPATTPNTATSSLVMDSSSSTGSQKSDSVDTISDVTPTAAPVVKQSGGAAQSANKAKTCFMYQEHLILSSLLLVYCTTRSLFIYEQFILYKFNKDNILLVSIVIEFVAILSWLAGILLITVKSNWLFKLEKSYKLINWNWFYDYEIARKYDRLKVDKVVNSVKAAQQLNTVESNVLYVRDDSVLNKSIDSNSTSEVSYMPVIVSSSSVNASSSMSTTTSNGSENVNGINSYSSFGVTTATQSTSNILDANKLYQKQQLNASEIEALYSKPHKPADNNFHRINNPLFYQQHKYDTINKATAPPTDSNQSYSRCIIISNDKITPENDYQSVRFGQRSYSHRLPKAISFDASNLIHQNNFRKTFIKPTTPKSVLFVDSTSATDSGRDSLTESPVSSNKQQATVNNSKAMQLTNSKTHYLDSKC